MPLKNYTTEVPASRTIAEIEDILMKHKATDIWKQIDASGNISSLNFAVNTPYGKIPFRLPVNVEAVRTLLISEKKRGKIGLSAKEVSSYVRAERIAWRIIKDWIHAQMALVDISMVTIEQVFLPYALNMIKGQTLYETLKETKFQNLLMAPEPGKDEKK